MTLQTHWRREGTEPNLLTGPKIGVSYLSAQHQLNKFTMEAAIFSIAAAR